MDVIEKVHNMHEQMENFSQEEEAIFLKCPVMIKHNREMGLNRNREEQRGIRGLV